MVADGEGEALVTYNLTRLARSLAIQEAGLAHVWRAGERVFALDQGEVQPDDPDDPMRRALRQMVGVFSELEKNMIAARLRAARRLKASQGGYAGAGSPPLGFSAEHGELVANPAEQAAVARIGELRASGASIRTICAALTAEGHRPKRSARWHPEMIRRVLAR
jgi:DNA invertase Pin-like site-specific DNA recombinase